MGVYSHTELMRLAAKRLDHPYWWLTRTSLWAVEDARDRLHLAADEIEDLRAEVYSLRSRLEAVVELASGGAEE